MEVGEAYAILHSLLYLYVGEAYAVLSDEKKRRMYDSSLSIYDLLSVGGGGLRCPLGREEKEDVRQLSLYL